MGRPVIVGGVLSSCMARVKNWMRSVQTTYLAITIRFHLRHNNNSFNSRAIHIIIPIELVSVKSPLFNAAYHCHYCLMKQRNYYPIYSRLMLSHALIVVFWPMVGGSLIILNTSTCHLSDMDSPKFMKHETQSKQRLPTGQSEEQSESVAYFSSSLQRG
jgi:hypothetical protein